MRTSLTILLGILFSVASWGATVKQVKNNRLLLQLNGESVSPGAQYFVINSAGKKIGLVSIKAVKGDRALGIITKGRANPGDQATLRSGGGGTSSAATGRRHKGAPVGILLGYTMDSMALTIQSPQNTALKENATLTGSTFSAKGFYDYDLSKAITIRGATGLEGFSAKGSTSQAICDSGASTSCQVEFNYLAFEGSAHYNFLTGPTKAWIGLGYSFLLAISKKNNIPNLSSDSATNQMILVGAGADFSLSNGSFIPVVVEYGMFPGSSNVTASSINLRSGYGFTF